LDKSDPDYEVNADSDEDWSGSDNEVRSDEEDLSEGDF